MSTCHISINNIYILTLEREREFAFVNTRINVKSRWPTTQCFPSSTTHILVLLASVLVLSHYQDLLSNHFFLNLYISFNFKPDVLARFVKVLQLLSATMYGHFSQYGFSRSQKSSFRMAEIKLIGKAGKNIKAGTEL